MMCSSLRVTVHRDLFGYSLRHQGTPVRKPGSQSFRSTAGLSGPATTAGLPDLRESAEHVTRAPGLLMPARPYHGLLRPAGRMPPVPLCNTGSFELGRYFLTFLGLQRRRAWYFARPAAALIPDFLLIGIFHVGGMILSEIIWRSHL